MAATVRGDAAAAFSEGDALRQVLFAAVDRLADTAKGTPCASSSGCRST